jgi:hypothetical protein
MESRSKDLLTRDGQICVQSDLSLRRGDANHDGAFDISDPIFILSCLFSGTACPECRDAADANGDGGMDIADPVYLLNWRFGTGSPPLDPFSACGLDTTEDALDECAAYPPCL